MLDQSFYEGHLERVSRSFAFCIAELRSDLRDDVALAYLLFRVLDTIEDSTWSSRNEQALSFQLFNEIVQSRGIETERIESLLERLGAATMSPAEQKLVDDLPLLLNAYIALEGRRRGPLQQTLRIMGDGMKEFALQHQHQIKNLAELDRYCYFVAGCIGELLTQWVFPREQQTDELLAESVHFGLFLQKINILKDMTDDSRAGRSFVFSWAQVAATLPTHARAGYRYIQQIPPERNDFRIFCAWSLFLGLASFPYIERSFRQQSAHRIPRPAAGLLIARIKKLILAGASLDALFGELSGLKL